VTKKLEWTGRHKAQACVDKRSPPPHPSQFSQNFPIAYHLITLHSSYRHSSSFYLSHTSFRYSSSTCLGSYIAPHSPPTTSRHSNNSINAVCSPRALGRRHQSHLPRERGTPSPRLCIPSNTSSCLQYTRTRAPRFDQGRSQSSSAPPTQEAQSVPRVSVDQCRTDPPPFTWFLYSNRSLLDCHSNPVSDNLHERASNKFSWARLSVLCGLRSRTCGRYQRCCKCRCAGQ